MNKYIILFLFVLIIGNFQLKMFDIFSIFDQNKDYWYILKSPH